MSLKKQLDTRYIHIHFKKIWSTQGRYYCRLIQFLVKIILTDQNIVEQKHFLKKHFGLNQSRQPQLKAQEKGFG